jgi:predicted small lipoprotein YifL
MSERSIGLPGRGSAQGRLGAALAAALVTTSLAACGNDGPDDRLPATPPPLQSPTPESGAALDPADAEAAEEILAAFDAYMEAMIELSTAGVLGGVPETEDYLENVPVFGPLLLELKFELLTPNHQAGVATAGTIEWSAEVIEIDWEHRYEFRPDSVVPAATLRVCFDESNWTTIDKETGEIVDGPGSRYLSTVKAHWSDEDPDQPGREPGWSITFREDESESC